MKTFLSLMLLNTSTAFNLPTPTRRSIIELPTLLVSQSTLANTFKPGLSSLFPKKKLYKERVDPYAHWSFFGIAPPPIERTLSYEELLKEIKNNNIISIEIAVQHDCIIGTTPEGHRFACLWPDRLFSKLLEDSKDENGDYPFQILPINPYKAALRNFAQGIFGSTLILYIAADLDLIPLDTTPYASWQERKEFYEQGKKPKKFLRTIVNKLFLNKNDIKENTNTTNLYNVTSLLKK